MIEQDIQDIAGGLRRHLEPKLSRYLDILRDMVAINSFTANADGVNRLGEFTARLFATLGFTAEHVPSVHAGYGRHLVLSREVAGGPAILCVSHLDTVYTEEEERLHDFICRVEDDRIYGPGTNDIKGGTLVLFMMLEALQAAAPRLFEAVNWRVILNASEEVDSDDFAALCRERMTSGTAACLVFEAGRMENGSQCLVTARKGRAVFRVTTMGKSAHAGADHAAGASAIVQMADVIRALDTVTDYERGITVNVGTVTGGTVVNRVPHEAAAVVEMRAFDPSAFIRGRVLVMSLDGLSTVRSGDDSAACSTAVRLEREIPPWPENEGSQALFTVWEEAAEALGIDIAAEMRGGLSDGNYLWKLVPTIDGLGPLGDHCHSSVRSADGSSDQEYAVISSFVPRAALSALAVYILTEF